MTNKVMILQTIMLQCRCSLDQREARLTLEKILQIIVVNEVQDVTV